MEIVTERLCIKYPPGVRCPYKPGDNVKSPVRHGDQVTHFIGQASAIRVLEEWPRGGLAKVTVWLRHVYMRNDTATA